ncbi:hypothetical protein [Paucibacter sp. B51]|uniref:hypothetical protein n=1 Tax=Paucibacter sp. B51 TaxID=2993315 RepID=UPI0022EBB860|nr:hypothetical protein [Paucibacter sp. B51]
MAIVIAKSANAVDAPSVCGLKLGASAVEARSKFNLARVGQQQYVEGGKTFVEDRLEGKPKSTECLEVRTPESNEPSVVVSVTLGPSGAVRSIAHRTRQPDCNLAENEITERLGAPKTVEDEFVEWRPGRNFFVVLRRYTGEDCWLSYVSVRGAQR